MSAAPTLLKGRHDSLALSISNRKYTVEREDLRWSTVSRQSSSWGFQRKKTSSTCLLQTATAGDHTAFNSVKTVIILLGLAVSVWLLAISNQRFYQWRNNRACKACSAYAGPALWGGKICPTLFFLSFLGEEWALLEYLHAGPLQPCYAIGFYTDFESSMKL